jgi:hypothetical protein
MLFGIIVLLLLLPVAFAWWDWFGVPDRRTWRKALSIVGLLLLTTLPILSLIAMRGVSVDQGVSPRVIRVEGWMFEASVLSIPFLCFGYRRARWLGIVGAVVLPLFTFAVDSSY